MFFCVLLFTVPNVGVLIKGTVYLSTYLMLMIITVYFICADEDGGQVMLNSGSTSVKGMSKITRQTVFAFVTFGKDFDYGKYIMF